MALTNETLSSNFKNLQVGGALRRQLERHESKGVIWEINSEGSPSLNINGQPVYHPTAAVAMVAQEINAFLENQNPDLVVFFGLGLGLHLQFLRLKTQKPILIFEPGLDVPASVLPKIKLETENVTLITNTGQLIEAAGEILTKVHCKMAVGAIIPYRKIYPEAFDEFRLALEQVLRNIEINQATRAHFSSDWISQLGQNLPTLMQFPPISALGNSFAGKPGILVGAGPSLDQNIDLLKEAKGRSLICAVHTAVMPLVKAGVIPDLVVLIESQDLDRYFMGVQHLDQMILVPSAHTSPNHLQLGFKSIFTISMAGQPGTDWLERAYGISPLKSGGSVACTAFSMLHQLRCEPLILVGMDAAYTNNRTHAGQAQTGPCRVKKNPDSPTMSFTYLDDRGEEGQWDAQMVPAWGGEGTVLTRAIFNSFRHWFESASQTWASEATLINATEGGARFLGFEEMSLADTLAQYANQDLPVTGLLEEGLSSGNQLDSRLLGKEIQDEINTVSKAMVVASKAESTASLALKKLRSGQLSNIQPTLDKLAGHETQLRQLTVQTYLLNTLVGHRAMSLTSVPPAGMDKVGLTIQSVETSRKISRLVMEGGQELVEIFTPIFNSFLQNSNPERNST